MRFTFVVIGLLSAACGSSSPSAASASEDVAADLDTPAVTPDAPVAQDTSVADVPDDPNDTAADTSAPEDAEQLDDVAEPDAASDDSADSGEILDVLPPIKSLCVAIRGNGELITAHFSAMARIVETFGPLDGVAGGSSASITSFFTESMHMHPGVKICGGEPCSKLEAGARLGLLYKSLFGYLEAMTQRDEAVALAVLLALVEQAKAEGIGALVDGGNLQAALDALVTIFTSDDVKDLVNEEILTLLLDSPNPLTYVPMVWAAVSTLGSFKADSTEIFLRPGLVSFAGFADKLGRIGSFYAAYGPADLPGWEAFFEACALPGRGHPWHEVAAISDGEGGTCGSRFGELLGAWRDGFVPFEDTQQNRINDLVGNTMRVMVITSVLTGQAAADWTATYPAYLDGEPWELTPSFEDVRYGYWGRDADTSKVVADVLGFGDPKTGKALGLGQVSWREALSLSPAEPGLARAVAMDEGRVSAGGWPDLAPVLALRNAGCDQVVYVTRRGAESKFARAVAALAGMPAAEDPSFYDLSDPESSFSLSLSEAAGVWCTDWNAFGATQIAEIVDDSWTAPFQLNDPSLVPIEGDYPTITTNELGMQGCSPGIP